MKRHLLIIAIFLLTGAVVNVAVAWGCAAFSGDDTSVRPGDAKSVWLSEVIRRLPPVSADQSDWWLGPGVSDGGVGVRREEAMIEFQSSSEVRLHRHWILHRVQAGLPLLALEAWAAQDGRRRWTERLYWYALRQPLSFRQRWDAALPLRPIWPGFVFNTLFYAAILWLLICGPFTLRRSIRMTQGQCVKCGYPLGDSPVCSECGRELPNRAAVVA